MGNTVDRGGIRFEQVKDTWQVLDYNYGMELGIVSFEEGPGWVFKPISTFLDMNHLIVLANFMAEQPIPD